MEEFGKIWDFERFDFNMYWPLLNLYSDNFGFGPGGFYIRETNITRMKRLLDVASSRQNGLSQKLEKSRYRRSRSETVVHDSKRAFTLFSRCFHAVSCHFALILGFGIHTRVHRPEAEF